MLVDVMRRRVGALFLAMVLPVALVAFAPQARAGSTEIDVTTFADEFDGEGGGEIGTSTLGGSSGCSLREAIQAANTNAPFGGCSGGTGGDVIHLPDGTYELTRQNDGSGEDSNVFGDLDVTESVTIQGVGGRATVDAGARGTQGTDDCGMFGKGFGGGINDRVFHALEQELRLEGVTVTGGHISRSGGADDFSEGGGILVEGGAALMLTDSRVVRNFATSTGESSSSHGGGIKSWGTVTMFDDSRVNANGVFASNTTGGGISAGTQFSQEARALGNGAALDIQESQIGANVLCGDTGEGGGIITRVDSVITRSLVSDNVIDSFGGTSVGAGLAIDEGQFNPFVDVVRSVVVDNQAKGFIDNDGGGIANLGGSLSLERSTVDGNVAEVGFDGSSQGGGIFNSGELLVLRSTISNNTTTETSGLPARAGREPQGKIPDTQGGGIFTRNASAITNSTIARNESGRGGGLFADVQQNIELENVTVANNDAIESGGGLDGFGDGGDVRPTATIIAGNSPSNCSNAEGFIASDNDNLASDDSCGLGQSNDLEGVNPQLSALADNGGNTLTMRPKPGSPAIDHVRLAAPKQGGCPPPDIDQRGTSRPQNGDGAGGARCDAGAVEVRTPVEPETCPGFANDDRNQIVGTDKADNLTGTPGPDIFCGFDGGDNIRGLGGKDLIIGGDGGDDIKGGGGPDRLKGSKGDDDMDGGDGNDDMFGAKGDDDIDGEDGDDDLWGLGGNDDMDGGKGRDRLRGLIGRDDLDGGADKDGVFGGPDEDVIKGSDDDDFLLGGMHDDVMRGGAGDDLLHGILGDDDLFGETGEDRLFGGRGVDDLDGGPQFDMCRPDRFGVRQNCETSDPDEAP